MAAQRPSPLRSAALRRGALSGAEGVLDRVEVWAVGREEEQARACQAT